jgi:hypothetical protein
MALLAYLATGGRVHGRAHLAALLWPEGDRGQALASLRQSVSLLKKALGNAILTTCPESVTLAFSRLWVDVAEFQAGSFQAGEPDAERPFTAAVPESPLRLPTPPPPCGTIRPTLLWRRLASWCRFPRRCRDRKARCRYNHSRP